MRPILSILFLIASLAVLPGCTGGGCGPATEPTMTFKLPVRFGSEPVMQPQGWAIQQPQPMIMQQVPQLVAPPAVYQCAPSLQAYPYAQYVQPQAVQPQAVGPCNPAGPYSPPPVPQPVDPNEPDESIPANR